MNDFARHVLKTFVILYKLIVLTCIFRVERYQTTRFISCIAAMNELYLSYLFSIKKRQMDKNHLRVVAIKDLGVC